VETKVVLIKGTKGKGLEKIKQLPNLFDVGAWEKLIKIMKNKLMCQYKLHLLPSKRLEYILYTAVVWNAFAEEKKIGCKQLDL